MEHKQAETNQPTPWRQGSEASREHRGEQASRQKTHPAAARHPKQECNKQETDRIQKRGQNVNINKEKRQRGKAVTIGKRS